jgi:PIN domain nuclease of toxin-antitoxin system
MTVVLDASAILAVGFLEPGADRVRPALTSALVSAVTGAEVIAKYVDRGLTEDDAVDSFRDFRLETAEFDAAQAERSGRLRASTRHLGLSLGDRCCLALAIERGAKVMTADRSWAGLDLGIEIEVVR